MFMKEAKENWIARCYSNIEKSLTRNDNKKKTYQLMKDLTKVFQQAKATTVKDKSGKSLKEEQDILNRWNEYCSKLYNYPIVGDQAVLNSLNAGHSLCIWAEIKQNNDYTCKLHNLLK